ncbi:MAG: hypothetical protein AAGG00_08385 [Cyanobacteria bacterium P01_H01_bin.150]
MSRQTKRVRVDMSFLQNWDAPWKSTQINDELAIEGEFTTAATTTKDK